MIRSVSRIALVMLVTLCLSGCVSLLLGTKNTPPRFALEPLNYTPSGAEVITGRLIIDDIRTEAVFDTALIARAPSAQRYEYFENAEWADRVPRLFSNFMERSFENVASDLVIGDRTKLLVGDYILQIDVRSFHIDQSEETSNASIAYYARFLDNRNNVIAARLFEAQSPVILKGMEGNVRAFNKASFMAGEDTLNWVFSLIGEEMIKADS